MQNGDAPRLAEKLTAIDETTEPVVNDPRASVDPAVMDEHPAPHVGVPVLPFKRLDGIELDRPTVVLKPWAKQGLLINKNRIIDKSFFIYITVNPTLHWIDPLAPLLGAKLGLII